MGAGEIMAAQSDEIVNTNIIRSVIVRELAAALAEAWRRAMSIGTRLIVVMRLVETEWT